MNTDPKESGTSPPSLSCIDCGTPIEETFGGIAICGDCIAARGSCCPEFGAFDLTEDNEPREYSSPACFAHLFENENEVRHNRAEHIFFTQSGARLDYRIQHGGEMEITHTFVPQNLRGKGLASDLMKAAMEYAETKNLTISASCDYAKAYLQKREGLSENS